MCYVLVLSTTSGADLTRHNNELVQFRRELPAIADEAQLEHENRWYVGSKTGCSCTFRHASSVALGFSEPAEWYPEGREEIAATLQLIAIIRDLVESGEAVDCVDVWEHPAMGPDAGGELNVDLSTVRNTAFRFIENHHLIFSRPASRATPGSAAAC